MAIKYFIFNHFIPQGNTKYLMYAMFINMNTYNLIEPAERE